MMTLQECYEKMGGDYAEVLSRLTKEERIEKFMLRFLEDTSFAELCSAREAQNHEEIFRMIHTLKGVAQNLGFTSLYLASDKMTEAVRGGVALVDETLFLEVECKFHQTIEAIKTYEQEKVENTIL